jgi:hypothetical protein
MNKQISLPTQQLSELAARMQEFEASASRANTGTGSRREGEHFEHLVLSWWDSLAEYLSTRGADSHRVCTSDGGKFTKLTKNDRALYLPSSTRSPARSTEVPDTWFQTVFQISDILIEYPGLNEVLNRYAPSVGPYAGGDYPKMYTGLTTEFDGTIVCEQNGVLREKLLLEYKTAKSSTGRQIDGNAHERLSFQIMQYLEVATRYTSCSFVVLANGAFVRYRNKYHPNFHLQADRLSNFSWFHMSHFCTIPEYAVLASRLINFIDGGSPIFRKKE